MRGNIRSVVYGQALGDAIGWPFEFEYRHDISRMLANSRNLSEFITVFTDDTQMMLACIEGIHSGNVYAAYQDWMLTQEDAYQRRAPGLTCMGALMSARLGTIKKRINTSKGNGGIMRVAPYGMVIPSQTEAFARAVEDAAMTHSHILGWIPAGIHAAIISYGIFGPEHPDTSITPSFTYAVTEACAIAENFLVDIEHAISQEEYIHASNYVEFIRKMAEYGERLPDAHDYVTKYYGNGTADATQAIAIHTMLTYGPDFNSGIRFIVNTSNDSDTFGAVYGAMYGAFYTFDADTQRMISVIEERERLEAGINTLRTIRKNAALNVLNGIRRNA